MLTHRERVQACISDPASIDRPPVALWRHFPVDDQSAGTLAGATLAFQSQFDFDIVKVTPASSYCLKDWGAVDKWEGNLEGTRRFTRSVIESPVDWEKLKILDPMKSTYLSEQLTCLKTLRENLSPETPLIQTIFSPLAQAKNLVGKSNLSSHVNKYPESLQKGLSIIAKSTSLFVDALYEIGIDGIFYAIQHAQLSELTKEEYQVFGITYDLLALDTAEAFWCNIMHLHGIDIYFDVIPSYNQIFPIINWHDRETNPSLKKALGLFEGAVCGGIGQKTVTYSDVPQIQEEIKNAFSQTLNRRFILGTGCVVPIIAPYGNVMTVRKGVENIR